MHSQSNRTLVAAGLFMLLAFAAAVPTVLAQEPRPTPTNVPLDQAPRGSIRGTIYHDKNGDGKCEGTGEPVLAGIPIEFVSDDRQTTLYLQSGGDGTYGLVAAGLGTWQVTVRPPVEYVASSVASRNAFIGEQQLLALGINFCLRSAGTAPKVLPASGASAWPSLLLLITAVAGAGLIMTGLFLQRRRP